MWELQKHRGERLRERTGGAVFDICLVSVSCPHLGGLSQQLNRCMSELFLMVFSTVFIRVMTYACLQMLYSRSWIGQ